MAGLCSQWTLSGRRVPFHRQIQVLTPHLVRHRTSQNPTNTLELRTANANLPNATKSDNFSAMPKHSNDRASGVNRNAFFKTYSCWTRTTRTRTWPCRDSSRVGLQPHTPRRVVDSRMGPRPVPTRSICGRPGPCTKTRTDTMSGRANCLNGHCSSIRTIRTFVTRTD